MQETTPSKLKVRPSTILCDYTAITLNVVRLLTMAIIFFYLLSMFQNLHQPEKHMAPQLSTSIGI